MKDGPRHPTSSSLFAVPPVADLGLAIELFAMERLPLTYRHHDHEASPRVVLDRGGHRGENIVYSLFLGVALDSDRAVDPRDGRAPRTTQGANQYEEGNEELSPPDAWGGEAATRL